MNEESRRVFLKAGVTGCMGVSMLPLSSAKVFALTKSISKDFNVPGAKGKITLDLEDGIEDSSTFSTDITELSPSKALVHVRFKSERILNIKRFSVKVSIPLEDVQRIWYTQQLEGLGQFAYISLPWGVEMPASGHHGAFIGEVQNRFGRNRGFVAFKNQTGDGSLYFAIEYAGKDFHITLNRYVYGSTFHADEIDETVYIDLEDIAWNKTMGNFVEWYDSVWKLTYSTPDHCYEPAFNTWYPVMNNQSDAAIERFAKRCVDLGIKTFEIDAGWFKNAGLWEVNTEKIKDLRRTVQNLQSMGFKVIIWFNPFEFGGAPGYEQYRLVNKGQPLGYLCPRTKEARDRAVYFAQELMTKYGLDGLKVDFLDTGGIPLEHCEAEHEHTCEFVSDGVRETMKRLAEAMRSIKQDAIIEYRLNYSNVANRPFANCFRGQDAPSDHDHVRRHLALLRTWCRGVAPHADYPYWTPDVSDENVARLMATDVLFGVPTLSVDFDTLPPSHYTIAKAWLLFYQEHKKRLITSTFDPLSDDPHYSVARFSNQDYSFIPVYLREWPSLIPVLPHCASTIFLFNGTTHPQCITRITGVKGKYRLTITDIFLQKTGKPITIKEKDGVLQVDYPVTIGGMVKLERV